MECDEGSCPSWLICARPAQLVFHFLYPNLRTDPEAKSCQYQQSVKTNCNFSNIVEWCKCDTMQASEVKRPNTYVQ